MVIIWGEKSGKELIHSFSWEQKRKKHLPGFAIKSIQRFIFPKDNNCTFSLFLLWDNRTNKILEQELEKKDSDLSSYFPSWQFLPGASREEQQKKDF